MGKMLIALIKVGALGDVVRATSILDGLKRLNSTAEIIWITSSAGLPLVRYNSQVDWAVDWREDGAWRKLEYDWIISLDDERDLCQLASGLITKRLSGAYLNEKGERCYTSDLEEWFGMGILRSMNQGGIGVANQLKKENKKTYGEIFYKSLGLPDPVARPSVVLLQEHYKCATSIISANLKIVDQPIVGLCTGAGSRWKFKSWGEEQTVILAQRLHDVLGVGVLLLGGMLENERNSRIFKMIKRPNVFAAPTDLDILSFAGLVGECNLLVTSDSLAMHLGIAFKRDVVALFGPTSDVEIDIFGRGEKVVTTLNCLRCYLPDCGVRPHCMQSIDVELVFGICAKLLSNQTEIVPLPRAA
jgi:heptosyltransferase II